MHLNGRFIQTRFAEAAIKVARRTDWVEEFSGKVIGDPYLKLNECRGRSFGGTSDLWAGWSRQLDEYDFYNKNILPLNKARVTSKRYLN